MAAPPSSVRAKPKSLILTWCYIILELLTESNFVWLGTASYGLYMTQNLLPNALTQ